MIVKGEVQRVGYRDFVQKIARKLKIKGFVQNLRDGNVFIVCEGEKENLVKFLKEIYIQKHFMDVKEVKVTKESDYKDEFEYFDIKYGVLEEELGERMGTGIAFAGATLEETRATREDVKAMHEDLKQGLDGTRGDIQGMHGDMNKNFQKLDEKYHTVSKNLESLNENLTKVVEGLTELIKDHIEKDRN